MRSTIFLGALAAASVATAQDACSAYSSLSCLTADAAASTYCAEIVDEIAFLYPSSTQGIATDTVYSTTTVANSATATVTSVFVVSATSTTTDEETSQATITAYVTSSAPAARRRQAFTSDSCSVANAESILSALGEYAASTACSCLDLLTYTSTVWTTVVQTVTAEAATTTVTVTSVALSIASEDDTTTISITATYTGLAAATESDIAASTTYSSAASSTDLVLSAAISTGFSTATSIKSRVGPSQHFWHSHDGFRTIASS